MSTAWSGLRFAFESIPPSFVFLVAQFTTGVGGGFLWMTLWTVVLISIPLGLGYLFLTQRDSGGGTTDDALTVLRRRYANGEIDEEEFDARRRKLQRGE